MVLSIFTIFLLTASWYFPFPPIRFRCATRPARRPTAMFSWWSSAASQSRRTRRTPSRLSWGLRSSLWPCRSARWPPRPTSLRKCWEEPAKRKRARRARKRARARARKRSRSNGRSLAIPWHLILSDSTTGFDNSTQPNHFHNNNGSPLD